MTQDPLQERIDKLQEAARDPQVSLEEREVSQQRLGFLLATASAAGDLVTRTRLEREVREAVAPVDSQRRQLVARVDCLEKKLSALVQSISIHATTNPSWLQKQLDEANEELRVAQRGIDIGHPEVVAGPEETV